MFKRLTGRSLSVFFFFFQAEDGIRDLTVTGVQTCALPILMGHYAFGGRTGGSVILYGLLFLILGLFFSGPFAHIVQVFPLPILGVLLLKIGRASCRERV